MVSDQGYCYPGSLVYASGYPLTSGILISGAMRRTRRDCHYSSNRGRGWSAIRQGCRLVVISAEHSRFSGEPTSPKSVLIAATLPKW